MSGVYRYDVLDVPDNVLVQCLQMFKSTITQDFVRCKKTKPDQAWVFPYVYHASGWAPWTVCGWGLLEFEDDTGIVQLFVDDEYRRTGIGKMIFKQMEQFATEHGKKIGYFVSDKDSRDFFNTVVNKESNT